MTSISQAIHDRSLYIGSSDAGDILLGNFDRLYDLKTGAIPPTDLDDVFPVQLGRITEDFHLDWTLRRHNEEVGGGYEWSKLNDKGDQHAATFDPEGTFNKPLLASHPDALIRDPQKNFYPVEVKITGRWNTAEEAADYYMAQIQHHMLCWQKDMLLFSVVMGTSEPVRIWIGASVEWQRHYIERCDAFWGHLKSEIPPTRQVYVPLGSKPFASTAIRDTIPYDGMKRRSLESNNKAPQLIADFILTKREAARHDKIKDELKGMMADDEKELYCDGFAMKRDKRGAIRFTVSDEEKFVPTA